MTKLYDVVRKDSGPDARICDLPNHHAVVSDCACGIGYQIFISDLYLAPGEVLIFTVHYEAGAVSRATIVHEDELEITEYGTTYHLPTQITMESEE